MNVILQKWLPIALAVLMVGWMASRLVPEKPGEDELDLRRFAELPVQVGGRIKPLDSVARNHLLIFSERQKVVTPEGVEIGPTEWMAEVAMRPEIANTFRVFKLVFPENLGMDDLVGLNTRHLAYNDLLPYRSTIFEAARNADPEPQLRSAYERQMVRLAGNLNRYERLLHSFHPPDGLDLLEMEYTQYLTSIEPGMAALQAQQRGEPYDEDALNRLMDFGQRYIQLSQVAMLRVIPPVEDSSTPEDWENVGLSLMNTMRTSQLDPFVAGYAQLTSAYRGGDVERFNEVVNTMWDRFTRDYPGQVGHVDFEYIFNISQPFGFAMSGYVLVFLLALLSWLTQPKLLSRSAFWVALVVFLVHTFGLLARMYIQGRPPVTNLYSSAIFVGWGAAGLALLIEIFYKNGVGSAVAALVGFPTLIVAHHLSLSGDTLEMMQAVLDSNFWLATHVVVITLGYSAMFVAGALGIVFVLMGIFSKGFGRKQARQLGAMIYGTIAFAALFSLVGTILGGIWADQSWGRFWGWDPKENGALLIVLWTAIILHARWGGIAKERGIAALAIFGNVVTAWSWFGTNMLGVGLHTYGWMEKAYWPLMLFNISQFLLILLAYLPREHWRSQYAAKYRSKVAATPAKTLPAAQSPDPAQ